MAELSFTLFDLEENKIEVKNILFYEQLKDIYAPCDAIRLSFITDFLLPEINRVEAYYDEKLVFSGFADTQREEKKAEGFECFIYARSSACLLVDNEAPPVTYYKPSVSTLFNKNARQFGFILKLPDYSAASFYRVDKGCSCYGAINKFFYAVSGKRIAVTPNGELIVPTGKTIYPDECSVISAKRIINRGNALTKIDFKNENDLGYYHHIKSRFFENKKIEKSKKLNLSSYPSWQKSSILLNTLEENNYEYEKIELSVSGYLNAELYDKLDFYGKPFGELKNFYISSVSHSFKASEDKTAIELCRKNDLKEIIYVDK